MQCGECSRVNQSKDEKSGVVGESVRSINSLLGVEFDVIRFGGLLFQFTRNVKP